MRIILFGLIFPFLGICGDIWIDMGSDPTQFEEAVFQQEGLSMSQQELSIFEKKSIEQSFLLSKIDFWSKKHLAPKLLEKEISELQVSHVFSQDNRLLLFEFLKSFSNEEALTFQNLCRLYANDTYLKVSDPFFESSCSLNRQSIKELNSNLSLFDYLLVDGNRIDLRKSPYFFSTDAIHQFIFISNRYKTFEITDTAKSLKKANISIQPWINGSCEAISNSNIPVGISAKTFFSKDCIVETNGQSVHQESFISRNRYYIISTLIIAAVAYSVSSRYELAVGLNP